MFLRCILLVLSILPLAKACVPTVPPEEYYPTSSLPETSTGPMRVTPTPPEPSTTAGGGGVTMASTTAEAENMCGDCDVEAIAPTLDDPDNTQFATQEQTPVDGCKRTFVTCQRTDDIVCTTITMIGSNGDQSASVADEATNMVVYGTLSCGADGKYSKGTLTGITQLSCKFLDCR